MRNEDEQIAQVDTRRNPDRFAIDLGTCWYERR